MSFTSLIPSFLPHGISSRLDFQTLLDQRGRLLQVHTALPTLALIPERMVMREAVSQPFELVIDCLSTSAHFELKLLVGEQVSVGLLQPRGLYKPWHGYVFEAAQLGSDGALARYRLVLRPWLCCLEQSLNSRVFESKTARDILEDVFAAYPEAQFRFEVTEELRQRSTCTQYRESDLAFVQRLLAEEGLSYHFEHAGDAAELAGATSALHTLVITDRTAPRVDLGDARFTAQHATAFIQGQKDAVTAFKTQRRLQPNAVALGSWNYRELVGSSATLATALEQGDLPTLEVYDGSGAYRYENTAHAQRATELALGALELQVKTFEGQGSTRHFEAGRQFSLIDHPLYGAGLTEGLGGVIKAVLDAPASLLGAREDNRFTILAVEHHAANNLGSEAAALLGPSAIERGGYRNQFHAAPAAAPVLPRFTRKPTAPGAQTALVVGLEGEALNTDRDHRVKVRFYWQRDDDGNSGTWVRVMSPQAGANWGAMFTPRIGTEVLVEFIEGDIDRPVITAALYNGQDRPPFSAGVDSGVNHPGTLSGIHSHSLDQSGFNQWVLDDATAQVRMRLMCSYSAAEVGLGHLIQQAAHTAQRGAWRGSGFEAATRAWASLRSAKGMLISTTARPGSYGSAQSTQMDATEAVAQLKGAQDLAQRLSQAAQTGQAQALTAHAESIPALIKTLDPEQDGKLTQAVNGQDAKKAQGRDLSEPVEAPATPTILLDTPSSQAWLSDASIASYAGQDLARVSQGDQHETAAHTHATVAGQTVSLYTHAGGITAHAANGPVSLRAHTDELQILADKDVTILSVNGEIHINAQSKIELIGADSGVILEGGDITFVTPGTWEAKGAAQAMLGGVTGGADLPALPSGNAEEAPHWVATCYLDAQTSEPMQGVTYDIHLAGGAKHSGILNAAGLGQHDNVPNKSVERIEYHPREPDDDAAHPTLNLLTKGA
ncbi:type VI secretion system Vgr family protein [Ideonella sp.]|jgi:type VI secretion system secreted protein VgrG|uniref:type VI secretion system Vgr family protein n=1 Tax=Ideonella sp. TaxID=1929293 RepID=UPI0037BF0907